MAPIPTNFLVGPPSLRPKPPQPIESNSAASDAFVDTMLANYQAITSQPKPPQLALMDNDNVTYVSTGNPCVDFFFKVVPNTPESILTEKLQKAWEHDPLTSLKLVCNLRGVRGTGKSDKEGFYTGVLWLHKLHPKTLACNVGEMAEFGYFKDLPEILFRILEGADVRKVRKAEHTSRGGRKKKKKRRGGIFIKGRVGVSGKRRPAKLGRERRVLAAKRRAEKEKKEASKKRHEKKVVLGKRAVLRYGRDPDYKFLHERVSDFFADKLKADLKFYKDGKVNKISLAAKWCPSLDSAFDKATLLCESIAKKVFPRESYPEYDGLEKLHYAYRVRDRLRKEVLVPLRKALQLPEVYIGQNDWGSIPYSRVPSVAMTTYKEKFLIHDKERFEEYLNNVKEGNAKIAAGAMLPHEIVKSLDDDEGGEVAELQWKRMVDDLAKKGKLKNSLAICGVSRSMKGVRGEVAVALGLLVSELSEEPWKGKLITFSTNPKLQVVEGDDLRTKIEFVRELECGEYTDFQKVFDLILEVAERGKLTEEQMIKRVFVFSDMEFDDAAGKSPQEPFKGGFYRGGRRRYRNVRAPVCNWETDYQAIERKFAKKGYESAIPEIVFWNLRNSEATPVPENQQGVALVSGFSKNLMTRFLEDNGALTPEAIMEATISGEEYKRLVVVD